jgi:hypothetical protein
MKYCPRCGAEFYDAFNECEDCNEKLVSAEEWETLAEKRARQDAETFVKIATVNDRFEADVLRDALEKEQIPVLIRSFQDTSFNGIFIPQKGWGVVEVPEEHSAQARELIEALRAE